MRNVKRSSRSVASFARIGAFWSCGTAIADEDAR